jgi:hypothetical protein
MRAAEFAREYELNADLNISLSAIYLISENGHWEMENGRRDATDAATKAARKERVGQDRAGVRIEAGEKPTRHLLVVFRGIDTRQSIPGRSHFRGLSDRQRQSQAREKLLLAAMRADDQAVAYLHMFEPAVALATACSVEQMLAKTWEIEQEEMRRRHDPSRVMCLTDRQRSELRSAIAKVPAGD